MSQQIVPPTPIAELWRPRGVASVTSFPSVSMSGATTTWSRQGDAGNSTGYRTSP